MKNELENDVFPLEHDPYEGKPFIYLACPYTATGIAEDSVREFRFKVITRIAADFIKRGNLIYSPITYTHPIAEVDKHIRHEDYITLDMFFLKRADLLMIACLPGWEDSQGIKMEIQLANDLGKGIIYLDTYLYEHAVNQAEANINELPPSTK